jgi:hypothetical protein
MQVDAVLQMLQPSFESVINIAHIPKELTEG